MNKVKVYYFVKESNCNLKYLYFVFDFGCFVFFVQVIDPEDEFIISNDGLWIEKKYPDIKTKSTIITKEGELLNWLSVKRAAAHVRSKYMNNILSYLTMLS